MAPPFRGGCTILKPFSWYADLLTAKGRASSGYFLAEGSRVLDQLTHSYPGCIEEYLCADGGVPQAASSIPYRSFSQTRITSLTQLATAPALIAVVKIPEPSLQSDPPQVSGNRILVLEGIQDPGNVGTLIRSAAAFNFDAVFLDLVCADPFSPKAVAATAGGVLSVMLWRGAAFYDALARLQKTCGFSLMITDVHGDSLLAPSELDLKCMLALGNEGNGISTKLRAMADCTVTIPIQKNNVESLNVAACGAICMYMLQGKLDSPV